MTNRLSSLKGLGTQSEKMLNSIGINTEQELRDIGPVKAYLKLKDKLPQAPSMNLLYAMLGALNDVHWLSIAKKERLSLLMELDGYETLESIIKNNE